MYKTIWTPPKAVQIILYIDQIFVWCTWFGDQSSGRTWSIKTKKKLQLAKTLRVTLFSIFFDNHGKFKATVNLRFDIEIEAQRMIKVFCNSVHSDRNNLMQWQIHKNPGKARICIRIEMQISVYLERKLESSLKTASSAEPEHRLWPTYQPG